MTAFRTGGNGSAARAVLASYLSPMTAQSVLRAALHRAGISEHAFERIGLDDATLRELRRGLEVFVHDEGARRACIQRLEELRGAPESATRAFAAVRATLAAAPQEPARAPEPARAVEVPIVDENGIVDARTRAKGFAAQLGFSVVDQYKIATAVSELSRNIFRYAGRGKVRFGAVGPPREGMFVVARDDGPGIANLEEVLSEAYVSRTGLGRGLQGCKRIMDEFSIDTAPGRGTTVALKKFVA